MKIEIEYLTDLLEPDLDCSFQDDGSGRGEESGDIEAYDITWDTYNFTEEQNQIIAIYLKYNYDHVNKKLCENHWKYWNDYDPS